MKKCGSYAVAEFLLIPNYRLELGFFRRICEIGKQAKNVHKSKEQRVVGNIFATDLFSFQAPRANFCQLGF